MLVATLLQHGNRLIDMTISLGISDASDPDATPESLIEQADRALYQAKHSGRNRVA